MTIVSDSVLVESKSACDNQLECALYKCVLEILDVVNLLSFGFATWKKELTPITRQIAAFEQEVAQ